MFDKLTDLASDAKAQLLLLMMVAGSLGRDLGLSTQEWLGVENRGMPSAKQLGIFMVLVFGAVALVVVTITLLFGMQIAGEFAAGIDVDNEYSDQANQTVNSTGSAFNLFAVSVLVIPATAVLAVLIGGLIGAVAMSGVGAPGMNGGNLGGR
jgi:ABC-type Fe3+ transport system permease subunit